MGIFVINYTGRMILIGGAKVKDFGKENSLHSKIACQAGAGMEDKRKLY